MKFVWTNRGGQRHELDSPAPIEAEAADVAREVDDYVDMLDNPDRMIRDPARIAIRKLHPRLEQLRADLERWNAHAVAATCVEAASLVEQIDKLPMMIADVAFVVALHDEHDEMIETTAGAPKTRADIFAGPATMLQRRAIDASGRRDTPVELTRAEAKAWLDGQPRFARSRMVDGGWFAWTDRNGHAHRLADALPIEREMVTIATELAAMRAPLTATAASDTLYTAVISGVTLWARLQILKRDLERFDTEASAREDTAWTTYAADWRSKRNN